MLEREQWIWLPKMQYPEDQTCTQGTSKDKKDYCVVSCKRNYRFEKPIERVELRFSGDTFFRLFCNGDYVANGPAVVGGDFGYRIVPYSYYYATELEITENDGFVGGVLGFYALIRKKPLYGFESSKGQGGFYLHGEIFFRDGTKTYITTDESWLIRKENGYKAPCSYDDRINLQDYVSAQRIENLWKTETSPIPSCAEREVFPVNGGKVSLFGKEKREVEFSFDKIYAGYLFLKTDGNVSVKLKYCERNALCSEERVILSREKEYRGIDFHSVGRIVATFENRQARETEVRLSLLATCYPVTVQAKTETSDSDLNQVFDVCAHSLQYCRQTIHLDSPKHCEPLACTGDYYVETLMTAFTFGDLRLSAFDVRRTAELLRYNEGKMFHTSYSLIWTLMLWDTYRYTGEKALLSDCEEALHILLARFKSYLGENGLIETPPDYMFVDWLNPDGINLHHPPKALGQTCLNMFYFGALQTAAKIYEKLDVPAMANQYRNEAESLRAMIGKFLWDGEKGLFFEGLNTPTPEDLITPLMPQNVEKRYYRQHANVLAAYFEIFDEATNRSILDKVLSDKTLGKIQPYFMHFLLEAIYRNGLRKEYTLRVLEEWKAPIKEFPKGLPEGFHKPNEEYQFDYSHAWGGTPAYALPLALTGLEIVKEGFEEIRLSPSLLGLEYANVEIPTPFGMIEVLQKQGEKPKIHVPKEIEYSVK